MYQTQLETEELFNKRRIQEWIQDDIGNLDQFQPWHDVVEAVKIYRNQSYYKSKNERIAKIKMTSFEIATEVIITLLNIGDGVETIQAVATSLGRRIGLQMLDAVKCGAEIIGICQDTDLFEIIKGRPTINEFGEWVTESTMIRSFITPDEDTAQKIHMTMYLPPMLCEPRSWTDNIHGGLLLDNSSCILGYGNDHNETQSLDVLNKLQSIAWELNTELLREKELPKKAYDYMDPSELRKVEQHNERCAQSNLVYEYLLGNENRFFFVWKFDKRGRQYSQGYDVNLQGSEYKKAILQFADAEYLTGV